MAIDILEEVAKAGHPLSITEIASDLELSKGAVHTALTNLEARGYVQRASGSLSFALGWKVWELGLQAGRLFDLSNLVHDELLKLAELTGETTQITSYVSPGEVLFLHRVLSEHPVRAAVPIGDRAPASTTSVGQVLLAFQPEAEIEKVLSRPLPQLTPYSITDRAQFEAILQMIRDNRYSINEGLHYLDTVTMSVPIRNHTGSVVYALGVYGPSYRFSMSKAHEYLPALFETAGKIERKLGFREAKSA